MALLSIRLFGGFQVDLDGALVSGFRTQKARALLAYLATEADRPHSRTYLGGLLWPEQPDSVARAYVRRALADLRAILGDQTAATPILRTTAQTLQLNPHADHWIDVIDLQSKLAGDGLMRDDSSERQAILAKAIELYRGRFLEGFFLKGCAAFDEWQLLTAETIQRQVVDALSQLAGQSEADGDYTSAQRFAWRCAELEPLADEANRRVIRLLAAKGDSAAALAHYRRFSDLLADELETTPGPETVQLAKKIGSGQSIEERRLPAEPAMPLPPFLPDAVHDRPSTPLVARTAELAELHDRLKSAIGGQGQVLFVTGDAGQGKTALLHEFAAQAVEHHDDLVAVGGACSSLHGVGDAYLPFREILAQLSGDFVAQWEAGVISRELARRLWQSAPAAVEAMLIQGPDLIDTFVPATGLIERSATMPGGQDLNRQIDLLRRSRVAKRMAGAQQQALFDQCTRVLQAAARERPLLLLLDDLHWGDLGSLALLFHLGQRLDGCRLLVVGAYRPEEVALHSQGVQHPLERLVPEFQRRYGPITIDLNKAQGREFVDEFIDLEPNRLGQDFRGALFDVSSGHPLYTVELLQELRARGALVRDESGCWHQQTVLDLHLLPVRVEATIGRRVERLPAELRSLLDAAAVQGSVFDIAVVAAVIGETVSDLMRLLKELELRHRLITPQGSKRVGAQRLSYFRFSHILFRDYLIGRFTDTDRIALNEAVALAMESLYVDNLEHRPTIAGRLAWHFREAELPAKAARYYVDAGEAALRLYAYDEALATFESGLRLVESLPNDEERQRIELKLLIGLGAVKGIVEGGAASGLEQIWRRANRLSETVGDLHQRFQVFRYEWELRFERGDMRAALVQAEACLRIADELGAYQLESHVALGPTLYRLGEMVRADEQLAQALALCSDQPEAYASVLHTENPMVNALVNGALARWYLGYPDQARAQSARGIAAATTLDHPFSLTFAVIFAAALYQRAAMPTETERYARQAIAQGAEQGFALWSAVGTLYYGWARVAQGELALGLRQTEDGLEAIRAAGMEHIRFAAVLADVYLRCGEIDEGLALIEQLLTTVTETSEREWLPELYRLKGELTLLGDGANSMKAMACFERSVEVAAAQQSKSLELRATISLSRLLLAQGRAGEARQQLEEIWDWFEEGFDTPDLAAAAEVLAQL